MDNEEKVKKCELCGKSYPLDELEEGRFCKDCFMFILFETLQNNIEIIE